MNPFPSLAGNTNTQGLQATRAGPTATAAAPTFFASPTITITLRPRISIPTTSTSRDSPESREFPPIRSTSVLPGISLTSFSGLTDPTPRRELDQTYTISDTLSWYRGKHNWRFGGDYRRMLQSFRSAKNAEGSSSSLASRLRSSPVARIPSMTLATTSPTFCSACRSRRLCNPARLLRFRVELLRSLCAG